MAPAARAAAIACLTKEAAARAEAALPPRSRVAAMTGPPWRCRRSRSAGTGHAAARCTRRPWHARTPHPVWPGRRPAAATNPHPQRPTGRRRAAAVSARPTRPVDPGRRPPTAGRVPGEEPQERTQRRRRVDRAEHPTHPIMTQHVQVIDAVRTATIPATTAAALRPGFDPVDRSGRTRPVTRPARPTCSASRITGTSPAHDTRFRSSNTAPVARPVCNNRTSEKPSWPWNMEASTIPILPPRGHLLCLPHPAGPHQSQDHRWIEA